MTKKKKTTELVIEGGAGKIVKMRVTLFIPAGAVFPMLQKGFELRARELRNGRGVMQLY